MTTVPTGDQTVPTTPTAPTAPPVPPMTDEAAAAQAKLADPALAPTELAGIAADHPALWAQIARHPLAYPDLLDWLAQQGDDNVRTAVQQRREADAAQATQAATIITQDAAVPAQRKALFKTLWVYIVALVTMILVVPNVFSLVITLATASPGASLEETVQRTQSLMLGPWLAWMQLTSMVVGACWFFILRGRRLVTSDLTTTKPVAGHWGLIGKLALAMLAIQGGLFIVNILCYLVGINLSASQTNAIGGLTESLLGVAIIAVIGPVLEEVIFRGAILRHLQPYGVNFAIVTQALLFGIYHLNLYQGPFAFLMGLIFGYVTLRFSIKWAILLHIANNTIAVISSYSTTIGIVFAAVFLVALVVAIIWAILARAQHRTLIAAGRSTTIAHPFRTAWSHPLFIVVLVVGLGLCTWITAMSA